MTDGVYGYEGSAKVLEEGKWVWGGVGVPGLDRWGKGDVEMVRSEESAVWGDEGG